MVQQFIIIIFISLMLGCSPEVFYGFDVSQEDVINEAENYLGTKYLLGGNDKKGIDCSGLIIRSINKYNYTYFMSDDGRYASDVNADSLIKYNSLITLYPERGDLVGFYDESGGYYHVALFDSFTSDSMLVLDASEAGNGYVEYRVIENLSEKPHTFHVLDFGVIR